MLISVLPAAVPASPTCTRPWRRRRSKTRRRPAALTSAWRRPAARSRAPTARSVTTARPASTTVHRRATVVRDSSVARCARVTSTPAAFNAVASSTRTSEISAATADCASVSGRACAKKVEILFFVDWHNLNYTDNKHVRASDGSFLIHCCF